MPDLYAQFPWRFAAVIKDFLAEFFPEPDYYIFTSGITPTDPPNAIYLRVLDKTPEEDSYQLGQVEAGIHRYRLRIENVSKAFDEQVAMAQSSIDAKTIWLILARDDSLQVELRTLEEVFMGTKERVTKVALQRQEFLSGRDGGQFVFIARTDIFIDTSSTRVPI